MGQFIKLALIDQCREASPVGVTYLRRAMWRLAPKTRRIPMLERTRMS